MIPLLLRVAGKKRGKLSIFSNYCTKITNCISKGTTENTDGVWYLWIHVIEDAKKSTLAGIGWNMAKKISSLNFTVPKSIRKLQGDLERKKERGNRISSYYRTQNCSNSFALLHSIRGIQFCKGVSEKIVWACSPRGTRWEIKLKSQKLKTKSSSQFNSLWKMLKFGRVFTNLMQNSELPTMDGDHWILPLDFHTAVVWFLALLLLLFCSNHRPYEGSFHEQLSFCTGKM